MSIKSIILAAAAVTVTATAGAANTYFEQGRTLEADNVLELGLITAEGPGIVSIYDYRTGQQGALLGQRRLREGANTNVRVGTGTTTRRDVLAVVTVGGEIVATKKFDIND